MLELTPSGSDVMKGKAELSEGLPVPRSLSLKLDRLKLDRVVPRSPRTAGDGGREAGGGGREAGGGGREAGGWDESSPAPSPPSPAPNPPNPAPNPPSPASRHPDHYWTWRLLSAGFDAGECAAIRGVGRQVILGHALRALEDGLPVRCDSCLSRELIASLEKVQWPRDPGAIRSVLPHLPVDATDEEVQLFLNCRAAGDWS